MDGLEQISTVACSVGQATETSSAAKVYELDDASGHQHDIISFQVTVNHPVQVKVGHPFQDLMGVQSQHSLWQRTKPEGTKRDRFVRTVRANDHFFKVCAEMFSQKQGLPKSHCVDKYFMWVNGKFFQFRLTCEGC